MKVQVQQKSFMTDSTLFGGFPAHNSFFKLAELTSEIELKEKMEEEMLKDQFIARLQ
jgi:hypothetical protein